MAEFVVSSDNQVSESLIVEYRNQRVGTQTTVARVHSAIREGLAAEERFNEMIAPGGPLAPLSEYHAAKIAPLVASLAGLRGLMVQVRDTMESLEAAVPGLFPGVTQ